MDPLIGVLAFVVFVFYGVELWGAISARRAFHSGMTPPRPRVRTRIWIGALMVVIPLARVAVPYPYREGDMRADPLFQVIFNGMFIVAGALMIIVGVRQLLAE